MMCVFDGIKYCDILIERNCDNCKFKKTHEEFIAAQNEAAMKLNEKQLVPIKKKVDGVQIMSTITFFKEWD